MVLSTLFIKTENDFLSEKYTKQRESYKGDCGVDLYCPEDVIIKANTLSNKINLDIKCCLKYNDPTELKESSDYISYMLVPRSSTGLKTPLRLSNSIGIIDSGYRGYICAVVDNNSNNDYMIKKGDRLFQIVSPHLNPLYVELTDKLNNTTRGCRGFGSTGN